MEHIDILNEEYGKYRGKVTIFGKGFEIDGSKNNKASIKVILSGRSLGEYISKATCGVLPVKHGGPQCP